MMTFFREIYRSQHTKGHAVIADEKRNRVSHLSKARCDHSLGCQMDKPAANREEQNSFRVVPDLTIPRRTRNRRQLKGVFETRRLMKREAYKQGPKSAICFLSQLINLGIAAQ